MNSITPHPSGLIQAVALTKVYPRGREQIHALDEATFEVNAGDFVAIVGPSGSGKTTLLSLLGCMDTPSSGTLRIAGQEVQGLSERARTQYRREQIGFVFQNFSLLPTLTVAENVLLPALFARRRAASRGADLIDQLGLSSRRDHRPHQLSGGEMQRVAIARALINEPKILLADEPTGNLDSENARAILDIFRLLNQSGMTILLVTHNPECAHSAPSRLTLKDGRLIL
jgi:putative ABC transport system ATP-binding protein